MIAQYVFTSQGNFRRVTGEVETVLAKQIEENTSDITYHANTFDNDDEELSNNMYLIVEISETLERTIRTIAYLYLTEEICELISEERYMIVPCFCLGDDAECKFPNEEIGRVVGVVPVVRGE